MKAFGLLALLVVGAAGPIGCGSDASQQQDDGVGADEEVEDTEAKADNASTPVGTFKPSDAAAVTDDGLALVVLKTDKAFHAAKGPDAVAWEGKYKFTKARNTGARYVWLMAGKSKVRYSYEFGADKLALRSSSGATQELVRSTQAWCAQPTDCSLQNLAEPGQGKEWLCSGNVCGNADATGGGGGEVIKPVRVMKDLDGNAPGTVQVDGRSYRKVSSVSRIEFPTVALDGTSGQSGTLEFEVPKDGVSFSVVVIADQSKDHSYVYRLTDPNGKEIISPNPEGVAPDAIQNIYGRGQTASLNGVVGDVFTALSSTPVPIRPSVQVPPGTWRLVVARETNSGSVQPETRRVVIVMKHHVDQPAEGALGALRLNLFLAAGNEVGSVASLGSAPFETGLKDFKGFFGKYGLVPVLGKMSDIADRYNKEVGEDSSAGYEPNAEFKELMTGFPLAGGDVNLFFVKFTNEIGYEGVGSFDGASAGYTGVAQAFSGVVIAARHAVGEHVGKVTAHEIGHHLALYHTNMDQLSDTCAFSHLVDGNQCSAMGVTRKDPLNLMDERGGDNVLSPEQLQVIKLRPAVTMYNPAN